MGLIGAFAIESFGQPRKGRSNQRKAGFMKLDDIKGERHRKPRNLKAKPKGILPYIEGSNRSKAKRKGKPKSFSPATSYLGGTGRKAVRNSGPGKKGPH